MRRELENKRQIALLDNFLCVNIKFNTNLNNKLQFSV